MSAEDRRAHARYCLWFPVVVERGGARLWAVCHDASSGGLYVACASELDVGAEITVSFQVGPDEPQRSARGKVVRIESPSDNPRDPWTCRMAIEFAEPIPELQSLFRLRSAPPPPMPAS